MAAFEHTIESAIRGYHVYKDIWSPYMHEQLRTTQELGNSEDQHAVAVIKDNGSSLSSTSSYSNDIIGHVPKEISRTCWFFLQHDGEIQCEVIGSKRRSPLIQGGLEIPCKYKFVGKRKHIKKLKTLLEGKTNF